MGLSYRSFIDEKHGHNFLLHGDNIEILSSLLASGFRDKVDLIYIDPPFDSGADYVRKVQLRGQAEAMTGEKQSVAEQTQYEDIWNNDNYLQFMYERLILLRELLSKRGSIYLHCDHHRSHHLRFLLDEVFGEDNFINEIVWGYRIQGVGKKTWARKHDSILVYTKTNDYIFNSMKEKIIYNTPFIGTMTENARIPQLSEKDKEKIIRCLAEAKPLPDKFKNYLFNTYYNEVYVRDVWDTDQTKPLISGSSEYLGFPTQKPEALLERIIKASSNENSIVLDCFCGSGTAAAAAQRLGRRWIAADMNKGTIQTTTKRITQILSDKSGSDLYTKTRGFSCYHVNNYDFAKEKDLRDIIIEKYGLINIRDPFFSWMHGESLAYIAPLNKPLTCGDVQLINEELKKRPDEERNIMLFGNGSETGLAKVVAEKQKHRPINKIQIIDIQQEGLTTFSPAQADITITKKSKTASVKITDYISPSIMAKLNQEEGVFKKSITDFRAQIDRVLWDSDYDGNCFNIVGDDTPEKKTDFIRGEYKITLPRAGAKLAVKIIDMLGEETIIVK